MQIVRAFPERPPPGRPHIVDGWQRVPVDDYDYRTLAGVGDDVVSMDWDTACSWEDLRAFVALAIDDPHRVLVAPVKIYRPPYPDGAGWVWNVMRDDRRCVPGEDAHLFGFGLVYLPRALVLKFMDANPGVRMVDAWFAGWHHECVEAEARVAWDVRPVHLHYAEAESGLL